MTVDTRSSLRFFVAQGESTVHEVSYYLEQALPAQQQHIIISIIHMGINISDSLLTFIVFLVIPEKVPPLEGI